MDPNKVFIIEKDHWWNGLSVLAASCPLPFAPFLPLASDCIPFSILPACCLLPTSFLPPSSCLLSPLYLLSASHLLPPASCPCLLPPRSCLSASFPYLPILILPLGPRACVSVCGPAEFCLCGDWAGRPGRIAANDAIMEPLPGESHRPPRPVINLPHCCPACSLLPPCPAGRPAQQSGPPRVMQPLSR